MCTYFSGIHILAELAAASIALIHEYANMCFNNKPVVNNQADCAN